jgi:hypothetical protein
LAKRAGAYRSEKRKKEISRQKKQEEKRLRRLKKNQGGDTGEMTGEEQEDASPDEETGQTDAGETEGAAEGEGQ